MKIQIDEPLLRSLLAAADYGLASLKDEIDDDDDVNLEIQTMMYEEYAQTCDEVAQILEHVDADRSWISDGS